MNIFRMHIKPGGKASRKTTFDYCIDNNLLGVGWQVRDVNNTKNWEDYYEKAKEKYGKVNQCAYIHKHVKVDDLVWTRDKSKGYFLAKVVSEWEYFNSEASINENIDIVNIFRVELLAVPIGAVPGKVIASFRASRACQKIAGNSIKIYSRMLWNELSQNQYYDTSNDKFNDIFLMLDDEETEDLVFLYLQSIGWYVVPSSRKGDTMSFEYLAINPQTGRRALTQVKTGHSTVPRSSYNDRDSDEHIFLFQTNEKYVEESSSLLTNISRKNIIDFLRESRDWLPENFVLKMKACSM
ncbi:hypothetical protein [Psychrobacter sp. P2G3]|uniref:hypothetical protein n=1 Tax=Psychrobacter sp. P2G3 TaxID=1699622 RepID=UPI00082EBE1E|nr:hypothetical protein [Psychrobacter sp. P2G3]